MVPRRRRRRSSLALAGAAAGALALAAAPTGRAGTAELELVFHSGFEPDSTWLVPSPAWRDITGRDRSVPPPNDWTVDLDQHPKVGDFVLDLKAGTEEQRRAAIIPDPTGAVGGAVLQFWLQHPYEPSSSGLKGRVQANLTGLTGVHAVRHRLRMFVGKDFALLRGYPGTFTWLSLFEYWNDPDWGSAAEAPFRVTVDVHKRQSAPGTPLRFRAKGQIMGPGASRIVWLRDSEVEVPIGEWAWVDLWFREGDATGGRFRMTLTREVGGPGVLGATETVFDVRDTTEHPDDPTPGDGLPFLNPMKLYTSGTLVDYVRQQGGVLEVLWDDVSLWLDR